MGGYLAGRLRTKWGEVNTDEVYFRDTAHGFLAWAVASLVTASLLTSVIGSIVGGGLRTGASVASGVATAGSELAKAGAGSGSMSDFVDSLFRKDIAPPGAASGSVAGGAMPAAMSESTTAAATAEMVGIFTNSLRSGALPTADLRYVFQIVAQRTGLSPQDAEKRVNDTYARAQQHLRSAETAAKNAADKAREASAYAALWLFISLLAGAFVASLAATFGGRQRDD